MPNKTDWITKKFDLSPAQVDGFRLADQKAGCIWHKCGEGKTRIALAIAAKVATEGFHVLVVTRREAFSAWRDEFMAVHMRFQGFWFREIESLYEIYHPKYKNQKVVFVLSNGMLAKQPNLSMQVHMVVYDEGYLYKNPQSQLCKAANVLSREVEYAYILSGSVMTAQNMEDVWGQLLAINQQQLLARTLTDFRSRFMQELWIQDRFPIRRAIKGALARIAKAIAPITSVWHPKSTRTIRHVYRWVDPSPKQVKLLETLREEYILDMKKYEIELNQATTIPIKAQQISAGWLSHTDPETKKQTCRVFPSTKRDVLFAILEEITQSGGKAIVWCRFRRDVKILAKAYPSSSVIMMGGMKFDEKRWKSGEPKVCFATEASGASVNHFANCQYAIYFSCSPKWLDMQQSMGRTDRKSSMHAACYYYYLLMRGSLDQVVLSQAQASGKAERDLLLQEGLKKWRLT